MSTMLQTPHMLFSEAIAVFKTKAAIAEAAQVTPTAVSQWDEDELIPPLSAAKIAKRSNGRLKFDPDRYDHWNNRKSSS